MAQKSSKHRAEEAVLDLKGKLRQLNNALAGKGATITENAPLVATIKAVEGMKDVGEEIAVTLYKTSQFEGSPDKSLPQMKVIDSTPSTSLAWGFSGMKALKKLPEIDGLDRINSITAICKYNASMVGAITMVSLPLVSDASYAFSGCSSLESISIGDLGRAVSFMDFASGCSKLKSLTIGEATAATNIHDIAENCFLLEEFSASFGDKLGDVSYAFNNCRSLRRINGVLYFGNTTNYWKIFNGCISLEEVRIKGLKASLDLSSCAKLSVESVRYLVENAQAVSGERIDLSRALLGAHEEELGDLGDTASDKGWTINYK